MDTTSGATAPSAGSPGRPEGKDEELLGWLYVGGIPENTKTGHRKVIDAEEFLSPLS